MKNNSQETKMLICRAGHWHYHRRVPRKYRHVDHRTFVRKSLNTTSLEIAKLRRNALVEADDQYWQTLVLGMDGQGNLNDVTYKIEKKRYQATVARALAYGYTYKPVEKLVVEEDTSQLLDRIDSLRKHRSRHELPNKADIDALLGGVTEPKTPKVKVSKAFKIYLEEIAFDEIAKKSPKQKYSWEKTKRTSVNYFIEVIGDIYMDEITREMATSYRSWWIERMMPGDQHNKPVKPNTANRHIGNIRKLYEDYFTHIGQEERPNPFRKMFFKDNNQESVVPPFEDDWVRSRILNPDLFAGLNRNLHLMIYVLIETGARASEICNLKPEHIQLDCEVPHIIIKPKNRELKTVTSRRDIPLVGVALSAMRYAPVGFPHYHDKGELVSANLMKAFRQRELFPTPDHVIYSFRHSFEKRMLEAGLDYGLRCLLMGHKNDRPVYGDGGSLSYRRDELLKIAHPVPRDFQKDLSAAVS